MPRPKPRVPASLAWLVVASMTAQIPGTAWAAARQNPSGQNRQTNPLQEAQKSKTETPPPPLQDYRERTDASSQRLPRNPIKDLPLFGYNHFEPAREALMAYRAYLRRQFEEDRGSTGRGSGNDRDEDPSDRIPGRNKPPTPEEVTAVANLTDAQKLDLLQRQRLGKLTDAEKITYRALLYPNVPGGRGNGSNDDSQRGTGREGRSDREKRSDIGKRSDTEKRADTEKGTGTEQRTDASGDSSTTNADDSASSSAKTRSPLRDRSDNADRRERGSRSDEMGQARAGTGLPTIDARTQIVSPLAQLYQNISASVPTNYQLSGGDTIVLRLSSPTMELREIPLKVDSLGAITVPDVGRIIVRGQTLAQAEAALATRLQRFYRGAQVSLSLSELRTIPVTVTGESFAPGTYTVPAIASAFNLIYATGGPTEEGSMRQIEVRRRGQLVGTIDFYKFLITGDQTKDVPLEPGDVIHIPGRHSRVAVSGEVRTPAVFELLPNETLKETLQYAGGVKPSGVGQRVHISTLQPGTARILRDVDLSDPQAAARVPVFDGDTVDVFSVRPTLTNVVTIEGAVDQPGQYATTPNMTVADLIERARGLLSDAYPTLAHLYRWNSDNTLTLIPINLERALARDPAANIPLVRWDKLTVYTRQEIAWTGRREVTVRGAVVKPGIYYRSENMRVRDLLIQAGGTLPDAYTERAMLLHQRPDETYEYTFVNLAAALREDPANNVLIQDRDIFAVYNVNEARFTPEHVVHIQGEVVTPGDYPRGENMKLSDVLRVAGGLTPKAGDRISIAHARINQGDPAVVVTFSPSTATPSPDPVLQDGDVVTIQGRGSYQEKPYIVTVGGAVNRPGPVILNGPKVHLSEVIREAGGLKAEAFPEGAEFHRNPNQLATGTQRQITDVLNKLNDVLNQSDYKLALAKSDLERYKAISAVSRSSLPIAIPGFGAQIDPSLGNPALGNATQSLYSRDLVTPPRSLKAEDLQPSGNVAINLKAALAKPQSEDDVLMLDGDSVTVPPRPTTVQVIGAVMQPRGVLFREGAKLDYYLEQVGGFAKDAAKDRLLVVRVGGGLQPVNKVKNFMPGDVIMVPTKTLEAQITKRQSDFDSIFRSITNTALIVLVGKKLLGL